MKKTSAKGTRWTDGIIGTNENSVAEEINEVQGTKAVVSSHHQKWEEEDGTFQLL